MREDRTSFSPPPVRIRGRAWSFCGRLPAESWDASRGSLSSRYRRAWNTFYRVTSRRKAAEDGPSGRRHYRRSGHDRLSPRTAKRIGPGGGNVDAACTDRDTAANGPRSVAAHATGSAEEKDGPRQPDGAQLLAGELEFRRHLDRLRSGKQRDALAIVHSARRSRCSEAHHERRGTDP